MMRIPEDKQEEFQAKQQDIYMELCGCLVDQLPEEWLSATLDLTVIDEGMGHSISNPDGARDIVTPCMELFDTTLRLQLLFEEYKCMFKRATFRVWWDNTEKNWHFAVEYDYK